DRVAVAKPLGEVFALQHRLQSLGAEQAQDVRGAHLPEPLAIAVDFRSPGVEDLVELVEVRLRVGVDLLACEHRPRLRLAAGVSDHRGVVADDHDDRVAVVLKSPQGVELDEVADVEIGRGGVQAELDAELVTPLQALTQMVRDVNLDRALPEPFPEGSRHGRRAYCLTEGGQPSSTLHRRPGAVAMRVSRVRSGTPSASASAT